MQRLNSGIVHGSFCRRILFGCLATALATAWSAGIARAQTHDFFELTVRDAATQAPLACVDLRTTSQQHFTSDNNGKIAFYEPGLMGESVWFDPEPYPGYCFPRIEYLGLCSEGKAFTATEGGSAFLDAAPPPPDGICPTTCCDCCRPGAELLDKCCNPVTNPGCTVTPPVCPAICTPGAPAACDGGDDATQLLAGLVPTAAQRLRIEVRDEATGRGVPL
ncbi:MAG: hypothetical protein KC466_18910, partial [Myxococcales bacterium]|nr:hypothetical protein [Myxococcales bacterium]